MKLKYKNSYLTVTKLISKNTGSGFVYNTNNDKFVVKFIILKHQGHVNEFMTERLIGQKINPKHGATIRYSSILPFYDVSLPLLKKTNPDQHFVGYLIMDNLVQSKKNLVYLYKNIFIIFNIL